MNALIHEDFPAPVAPATSRCGIWPGWRRHTTLDVPTETHQQRMVVAGRDPGPQQVAEGHPSRSVLGISILMALCPGSG